VDLFADCWQLKMCTHSFSYLSNMESLFFIKKRAAPKE
jgi:hypothetical protein